MSIFKNFLQKKGGGETAYFFDFLFFQANLVRSILTPGDMVAEITALVILATPMALIRASTLASISLGSWLVLPTIA